MAEVRFSANNMNDLVLSLVSSHKALRDFTHQLNEHRRAAAELISGAAWLAYGDYEEARSCRREMEHWLTTVDDDVTNAFTSIDNTLKHVKYVSSAMEEWEAQRKLARAAMGD